MKTIFQFYFNNIFEIKNGNLTNYRQFKFK